MEQPGGGDLGQLNVQFAPPQVALATSYTRFFSRLSRNLLELMLLLHAALALAFLIYVQQRFLAGPLNCIEQQAEWSEQQLEIQSRAPLRDYVIRVHAQYDASRLNLTLQKSILLEHELLSELHAAETGEWRHVDGSGDVQNVPAESEDRLDAFPMVVLEYASSAAYLHLGHDARARLNLTVLFFVIDLAATGEHCCVRSWFDRALFDWFGVLDYDELVLAALRTFVSSAAHTRLTDETKPLGDTNSTSVDTQNDDTKSASSSESGKRNAGYIRNVLRGQMYQLVASSVSYLNMNLVVPVAAMVVFTGAVSMLLQHARAHISLLYLTLLQLVLELFRGLQAGARRLGGSEADNRPHVPLMLVNRQLPPTVNVLLAFIGVQTIMIEFFESEVTALGVMMLVWLSGEYVLLLRSERGRALWSRCFYLSHLLVYAFHYRCNGHYTELALYASFAWMLFFMTRIYHVYELPLFIFLRRPFLDHSDLIPQVAPPAAH